MIKITINVLLLFLISFTVRSQQVVTLCPDENTTFTYYSHSNTNGIWIWTVNNDTLSESNSVTITWDSVGTYEIIVNFYNECHLVPETYRVYVLECLQSAIYFANAFTPNGDGKNDSWRPIGFGIAEIKWYIFDRWGLQIYEANGIEETDAWDGCMPHKGERNPVQADVYVWLANWKDVKGKFGSRTGRVTIVR